MDTIEETDSYIYVSSNLLHAIEEWILSSTLGGI